MMISPTAQHRAIVAALLRLFAWPCDHAIELREEKTGDLRCACCDARVLRRLS